MLFIMLINNKVCNLFISEGLLILQLDCGAVI